MADKPALRARLRAVRDAFAPVDFPVPSGFLAGLQPSVTVVSYLPVGNEPDPEPLANAARDEGCRIALPRLNSRRDALRFHQAPSSRTFEVGPFGIRQPAADLPEVVPDVILAPLVGFDRQGRRLGQGGGHYDRAFAAWPNAWRVGVAWSVQEVDALSTEPWDMPLHAIATEKEWIEP